MRKLPAGLIAAFVVSSLNAAPAPALALDADATAIDACSAAIEREVHNRFEKAGRLDFHGRDVRRLSDTETGVAGKAEFEDRDGHGWTGFSYGCTYNARNATTYALDVRDLKATDAPGATAEKKDKKGDATAAIVIGALIAGAAIAAASDNDDKDHRRGRGGRSFSPSDGVTCYSRDRACYKHGDYSRKWTNRVF